MGRGQYDRAAAKAKRELLVSDGVVFALDVDAAEAQSTPQFARPGWPYLNTPETIVNAAGQPVTQADYDKLVRLCQTHGLMIE